MWQETFPVRFGAIDRSDRLTLSAMFQFFQEAAISHAENLGVGREDMAKAGQVWILSRMSVQVDRRPGYCQTITVRSWPRGCEKLFALRDYDILDTANTSMVRARSGWIIIDLKTRRPLRPQQVVQTMPQNEGLDALALSSGLTQRGGLAKTGERKALYTDVDYNGHVNNVRYVQWIEDVINPQLWEKADRIRLDLNYLNEILSGDTAEIWSSPLECNESKTAFSFEGKNTENSESVFRAELRLW